MALPIELIATIRDDGGDDATTSIKLVHTRTKAQVQGFGVGWAAALDNLIDGIIQKVMAFIGVDVSGLASNSNFSTSDVEDVGAFQFRTADNQPVKVNIPCFDESKVIAGSKVIDQTDSDVADFITMMTEGLAVTGGTIQATDIGSVLVDHIVLSKERWRNSGARKKA